MSEKMLAARIAAQMKSFPGYAQIRRIAVTDDGRPVPNLNELEWVKGEMDSAPPLEHPLHCGGLRLSAPHHAQQRCEQCKPQDWIQRSPAFSPV